MDANDENVFTDHVRNLDPNAVAIPQAVRTKLAKRLRSQLRRRGLLQIPAGTFGYAGRLGDPETFEELLTDAYLHLFFGLGSNAGKQLEYLRGQVAAGNQIDALVQRKLKDFVHDLHHRAYPADAGIYKNVKAAATQLIDDSDNDVELKEGNAKRVDLDSVLGLPSSGPKLVEMSVIGACIRKLDIWDKVLTIVQRFSRAATEGTAAGMLGLVHDGQHPFKLETLKEAVAELAYEPVRNEPMSAAPQFSDDADDPEFVRTILDEDGYEARQAKVDEFVHEGRIAIRRFGCDARTTSRLLEILQCYAERCRHCDSQKNISQAEVARAVDLPKQTMNDCMKKLRAALEKIGS
ncbi:MAG: hypothetical protein WD049_05830 [Candidatus Paceibacterota bacterium]